MSNIESKDVFSEELGNLKSEVLSNNPETPEDKPETSEVSEDNPGWLNFENLAGKMFYKKTRMMEEVPEGIASKIPQDLRLDRLFPDPDFKLPEDDKEKEEYFKKKKESLRNIDMEKYLKTITVGVVSLNKENKPIEKQITLRVHKKLANELIAAFKEIKEKTQEEIKEKNLETINQPLNINPIDTIPKKEKGKLIDPYGGYANRDIREGDKLSVHAYGAAIDLNTTTNQGEYSKNGDDENNPYYITDTFAQIMKNHGFYRGKDRKNAKKDPMHFSYTEKPDPVKIEPVKTEKPKEVKKVTVNQVKRRK